MEKKWQELPTNDEIDQLKVELNDALKSLAEARMNLQYAESLKSRLMNDLRQCKEWKDANLVESAAISQATIAEGNISLFAKKIYKLTGEKKVNEYVDIIVPFDCNVNIAKDLSELLGKDD